MCTYVIFSHMAPDIPTTPKFKQIQAVTVYLVYGRLGHEEESQRLQLLPEVLDSKVGQD